MQGFEQTNKTLSINGTKEDWQDVVIDICYAASEYGISEGARKLLLILDKLGVR